MELYESGTDCADGPSTRSKGSAVSSVVFGSEVRSSVGREADTPGFSRGQRGAVRPPWFGFQERWSRANQASRQGRAQPRAPALGEWGCR